VANELPYEIRPDGSILFSVRDEVKVLLRHSTATKVIVEIWRNLDLMPPDTGNINASSFRERLAKDAKAFFSREGEDTVPHILADLGMVALAMASPVGKDADESDKDEPTLWDILAKDNPFALMIKYAKEAGEYFHTAEQEAYATVEVAAGHRETYPINSRRFILWLRREFFRRERERKQGTKEMGDHADDDPVFPSRAAQEVAGHFEAIALFEGHEEEVFTRVAGKEGMIYVDLCDASWRAVEISVDGWRVLSSADVPVRFVRARGMLALPEPRLAERDGALESLRGVLNLGDDDISERNWRLILAWMAQAFVPSGPYPVLTLLGPQGSAKSTAQKILRNIIDASSVPLRSAPRDEHNLYIDARAGWVIALDNMSSLPGWLSDALCRLATGGGFSTRQLYTDQDQILFDAMRPVILNGIGDVVTRPDLLDRALIISLGSIPREARRLERELEADVEALKPGILAALFDAVAEGLAAEPHLLIDELPRMADFASWGVATEQALGGAPGSFMAAYLGSQDEATETAMETWAPGAAFLEFAKKRVGFENAWEGSATELLKALNDSVDDDALKRSKEWPKAPARLTEALNRLAPALLELGVHIERPAHSRREGRKLRIYFSESPRKGPSPSSPSSPGGTFRDTYAESDGDDGGDDGRYGDDGGDDAFSEDRHHENPVGKGNSPNGDDGDDGDDGLRVSPEEKNSGRPLSSDLAPGESATLEELRRRRAGVPGVVNVKGRPKEEYVYVGRSRRYGGPHYFSNPYEIGKDGDREEVLAKYEERLHEKTLFYREGRVALAELREELREGKALGCHCAGKDSAPEILTVDDPLRCHGQLLLRAMNDGAGEADDLLDDEEEL